MYIAAGRKDPENIEKSLLWCTPKGVLLCGEFLPTHWEIAADCANTVRRRNYVLQCCQGQLIWFRMVTISLTMKTRQILSANTTLFCRIGVIFVYFRSANTKERQKRRKQEVNVR